MRVLILAPHPFYIVRGTPIDLELVVRALSERSGTTIDLVVYNQGVDRDYPGLTIHRAPRGTWLGETRPGLTLKKLLVDVFFFFRAWSLVRRHRYDLVHAGEEAVFMALFFRRLYGIPYAYDLDSSIAEQVTEKRPYLRFMQPFLDACERAAIRGARITLPVCHSLADLCRERGASKIVTLHDISQLEDPYRPQTGSLKRELGIERLVVLYAGNLEVYQGIDLLLEGFALAAQRSDGIDLVIVGGSDDDIRHYSRKADDLGIGGRTHFLGPKPFDQLDRFLAEADILTAPRIRGRNTPMKVFPYLHSGKPVIVTDLPTHSQILTRDVAMLAPPTPEGFCEAVLELVDDEGKRRALGQRGRAFVEANHTYAAHRKRLNEAYDWIEEQLGAS